MTVTRNPARRTRKTTGRRPAQTRRRRRRLRRIGWGGVALTLFFLYIAIRTWPVQSIAAAVLLAAAAIVRAIRPARLGRLWNGLDRIAERRRVLPQGVVRPLRLFQQMTPGRFEKAIAELAREHPTVRTATAVGQANDRGADVLVHLNDDRRILTTASFTRAAVETNAMLPRQLRLIDGHDLVAWANGGPPPW